MGRNMQLPQEFCEEMKRILGSEYEDYLLSMKDRRKYGLRVNTLKISVEEFERICPFEIEKIPYVDNGFYYAEELQPSRHPYYFAGLYYLQDPSAMTPASRLPVQPGDTVLDLCAAPGGKATELAARLAGTGFLAANDISSKRAKALLKNIELFGVENSCVLTEYPARLSERFTGFFDKILIDAPCSGEGMFRKDPSMIRAWEQNGPAFYSALQRDILSQALPMLKPGGMLLYSTCTFSTLENEESVEYLLSLDDRLELVDMEGYSGFAGGRPELVGSSNRELQKCVRIFPHRLDGEGHFLALFRLEEKPEAGIGRPVSGCGIQSGLRGEEKQLFEQFAENLNRSFSYDRIESRNGMIYYMPENMPSLRGMRFLRSGLFLGEVKKKRFEPSQSLAMALREQDYKNTIWLSAGDERVYRYLKGETLSLGEEDVRRSGDGGGGFYLVCVDGYPLGWGKLSGGTLKNKYHAGWRLL